MHPSSGFGGATAVAPARIPAVHVRSLSAGEYREWDRFVAQHPQGTPFHLTAWKQTIEDTFSYQPLYLLAETDGGRIRGVLPLFLVRNRIIGSALISSPFAVYGGILATDERSRAALFEAASDLGSDLKVDYVELRNAWAEQCFGSPNVDRYFGFTQELTADEAALLACLPKKTRNLVRKSLKQPFTVRARVRDLTNFRRLLSVSYRRLGTPMFPDAYFDRLLENFGDIVDVREVWLHDRVMAASMNFVFGDNVHIYYAAADPRYNALGPNTFMYYDLLRSAGEQGLRYFDFGRSKAGTGTFEFKRHWNTNMRPLPYEVVLVNRKEIPNYSPSNRKFEVASRVWRKLPLPLTRSLGPQLIRLFP